MDRPTPIRTAVLTVAAIAIAISGCTTPLEYLHNGFKVGPKAGVPCAPTATHWIDAEDVRVQQSGTDLCRWWTVFHDPTLDGLVAHATSQNLTLREAGFRILEARAQLGIASGSLFPQTQQAFGGYQREAASLLSGDSNAFPQQFFNQWAFGFNLSWEIDFWGRFRRAVTAAEDTLGASCANYGNVLVTLQSDVAANYVLVRTLQQRIEYVRENVELQQKVLDIADRRMKAGAKSASAAHQARSTVEQTEAQTPQLRVAVRQACNRICVLLGMPPSDLEKELGPGVIPTVPAVVVVGIPAELLRRRPDVRRAELLAAAQGQQIGIAEADLYPAFAIDGTLGWQSENLSQLFNSKALTGNVGPVFQWNILNYGRIRNNMLAQDAKFKALVMTYQETVLRADAEVEDGLTAFLNAQERAQLLDASVADSQQAVDVVTREYQGGAANFDQLALIEQNLVVQQDLQAQAHGEIVQGLIQVYRALGGGWGECCQASGGSEQVVSAEAETVPAESVAIPPEPISPATMPAPKSHRASKPSLLSQPESISSPSDLESPTSSPLPPSPAPPSPPTIK